MKRASEVGMAYTNKKRPRGINGGGSSSQEKRRVREFAGKKEGLIRKKFLKLRPP